MTYLILKRFSNESWLLLLDIKICFLFKCIYSLTRFNLHLLWGVIGQLLNEYTFSLSS